MEQRGEPVDLAWERAVREADAEIKEAEANGKVFRPSFGQNEEPRRSQRIEIRGEDEEDYLEDREDLVAEVLAERAERNTDPRRSRKKGPRRIRVLRTDEGPDDKPRGGRRKRGVYTPRGTVA